MERIYDMIIIGGGPAGYSAALYASRAGLDTLVIEKAGPGGQMALTDIIENYPGFDEGVDGFTLGMKMQAGAEKFGAVTEYGEVVKVVLDQEIKSVETEYATYKSKTVVIATGANPRKLGIEGEDTLLGRGVHYCAHCDGRFYTGKTVAVVGGGNSAVSDALYLSKLAKKVYLIHRRDSLRATKIYHEPLMKAENVEFVWNSQVDSLVAQDKLEAINVKNVQTDKIERIDLDAVFVSIGREPVTQMFADVLELDKNGYIAADETTQTSLNGVYAVGDVRTKALRQVVTAVSDGAVAVHYAQEYLSLN